MLANDRVQSCRNLAYHVRPIAFERMHRMFFIRNLGLPFILIAGGLVALMGLVLLSQQGGTFASWAQAARAIFPWMILLPVCGALWATQRLLQIWRWRRGTLDGGCERCTGVMAGDRCRMCGQRR